MTPGKHSRAELIGRVIITGLAGVMTALAIAWHFGAADPYLTGWYRARPSRPTVLFVILDTVRADHLSLCGYDRPTSPTLERLAASSSAWTCSAYAPGSWTLPSHASYFTGLDVPGHGADFAKEGEVIRQMTISPLADRHLTLAERFRHAGYQTAGVSGNPVLIRSSGLAQGFDHWESAVTFGVWYGEDLVHQLRQVLRGLELSGRPLFLFVNIADAHDPWPGVPDGLDWVEPDPEGVHYMASREPGPWEAYVRGSLTEEEARAFRHRITNLYDYAVFRADDTLSQILEEVEAHGWTEAGLRMVVTADHGEFLGEHGLVRHGVYLREPNNLVPFVVSGTDDLDLPSPASALDAFHLLLDGELPAVPTPVTATGVPNLLWLARSGGRIGGATSAALWSGRSKLLWQNGVVSRYDLARDPGELTPLPVRDGAPGTSELADLVDRLEGLGAMSQAPDTELLERLRSLGYIR